MTSAFFPSNLTARKVLSPLPLEVLLVWTLLLVVSCEIFATYSRLPARQLYHVSASGVAGGASRVVVFWNWPVGLIALAVLVFLYERVRWAAVVAAVLCLAVVWPGVVDQANLDARPVNAIAAIGSLLALLLTLFVARVEGVRTRAWRRSDWARLAAGIVLLVVSAPWIAADLGFFLDGVPVLGRVFQTGTYMKTLPGLPPFLPAVHHGHHHGLDGFLFVASALLLSRAVDRRRALAAYVSLMACYGLGNMANDFWIEQVFKRHWTAWQIPSVLSPSLSVAWLVIVVAAAAIYVPAIRRRPSTVLRPGAA